MKSAVLLTLSIGPLALLMKAGRRQTTHKGKRIDNQPPKKEISKKKPEPGMKTVDWLEARLPVLS